jgi:hypothetical protein
LRDSQRLSALQLAYRDTTTVNWRKTLRMVRDLLAIRRRFGALPAVPEVEDDRRLAA